MTAAALSMGLLGCGGGESKPPGPGSEPAAIAINVAGRHITKLAANGSAWVGLAEKARRFENTTTPDRILLLSAEDGRTQLPAYVPPAGWSLIDFSVHQPSREISLVLASDQRLRLVRLSRSGALLRDQEFLDPLAAIDPIIDGPLALMDSQSLVPVVTRDASRLAAIGEDIVLGFRSGRFAVVLHRLAYSAGAGFDKRWRSLVEPGVQIGASRPMTGSFDPFKSVDHMWWLTIDADPQGRIAVALSLTNTDLVPGHAAHFGESLDMSVTNGFLLSRFAADGQRQYSVLKDTGQRAEVHGLRWIGERVAIVGRTRTTQTPDGWNGYVALLIEPSRALSYELIDVDQGEVLFDIAALPGGQLLASGAAGYTQNPTGASISETATPLLLQLGTDGKPLKRLPLPAGARQSQLRTALAWRGSWLLGGMENGPGTHSADGDESLLKADGYVREQRQLGL